MKDRLGKYKKYIEFTIEELNKLPKSRREAITLGEKFYFNGNLCKYKHLSPRRRDAKCRKCVNQSARINKTIFGLLQKKILVKKKCKM